MLHITIFTGGARVIKDAVQVKLGRYGTACCGEGRCKAIIVRCGRARCRRRLPMIQLAHRLSPVRCGVVWARHERSSFTDLMDREGCSLPKDRQPRSDIDHQNTGPEYVERLPRPTGDSEPDLARAVYLGV